MARRLRGKVINGVLHRSPCACPACDPHQSLQRAAAKLARYERSRFSPPAAPPVMRTPAAPSRGVEMQRFSELRAAGLSREAAFERIEAEKKGTPT